jgi:hypothetical protein
VIAPVSPRPPGLAGLVPLAELLNVLGGGRTQAVELAASTVYHGANEIGQGHGDLGWAIQTELDASGVVSEGHINRGRASELVAVCEVLAAASPLAAPAVQDPRIVLSAPTGSANIEDGERLESFVLDVIRQATRSLVIGGAFWNNAGFELLDEVLRPAVTERRVETTVYLNLPGESHGEMLRRRAADLEELGGVRLRWFTGPAPTMLHAKFVIRDETAGYLGSANLTSWGMRGHVEAGVELTANQCSRFIRFLDQLEHAGLFQDGPRTALGAGAMVA